MSRRRSRHEAAGAARRESVLGHAVAENENSLKLAQVRYEVGSGDLRGVQQQLAVSGARSALLRVETERLVQRVNLYLALGGGFDARPATPVARAEH